MMDAKDLTVEFDDIQPEALLVEWHWLIGRNKLPILVTVLGDVFVQDLNDGVIYYLNTASADLMRVADSVEDFGTKLGDDHFIEEYFAPEFVAHLRSVYGSLPEGMLFSWNVPDELGGEILLEDMGMTDIDVHFTIWGQVHFQVFDATQDAKIANLGE